MPRIPAGELNLSEIRNLARQHNKVSTIKGIDKLSRKALMGEIQKMGYEIDHSKKRIRQVKKTAAQRKAKDLKPSASGERKPQQKTIKKKKRQALIGGGSAPVLTYDRGEDEV
tara:strand:- start:3064 stop:3402 length:339 start_codon:yes stop_codon:yes gene_type:complete